LDCCALLFCCWSPFQELVDFSSIKLGWHAVGMDLIGQNRFLHNGGQTIHVTAAGRRVLYLVLQKGYSAIRDCKLGTHRGVLGLASQLGCLQLV
jgi:hypothetical protein